MDIKPLTYVFAIVHERGRTRLTHKLSDASSNYLLIQSGDPIMWLAFEVMLLILLRNLNTGSTDLFPRVRDTLKLLSSSPPDKFISMILPEDLLWISPLTLIQSMEMRSPTL